MNTEALYGIVLTALPIILSLSVHEFAHARTALAFGDPTAKSLGRCTLNPLAHLDPIGTIMMFLVGFGWAKPVPVNMGNLHPPRMGNLAVSAAGPLSNLGLAIVCAAALRVLVAAGVTVDGTGEFIATDLVAFLLTYLLFVNLVLCVFNLLPLFPLDGHHIARETLPAGSRAGYMQWQHQYGRWLLMALIIAPMLLRTVKIYFRPLTWYFGLTVSPLLMLLLGDEAGSFAHEAMNKFDAYLFWRRR